MKFNGKMKTLFVGGQTVQLGYDAENRLVSVSGPNLTATFYFDGDGRRVKSVINSETTYFAGGHFELKGNEVSKYYFAGASRIAVRKYIVPQTTTLTYLLGDHLGSTSLAVDASTGDVIETRYKPWGEVRFTTDSKTLPTRYTFTGQYSYVADSATDLGNAGFGLMFYNARMYDPVTGRFAQADTVVPGGVQGLDRYAYVNNSPVNYVDPSGHFTEEAIWNYVFEECDGDYACATDLYGKWKADKDWWDKLLSAQPGDVLFGSSETTCDGGVCNYASAWAITFGENMTISTESGLSLVDVQAGHVRVEDESSGFGANIEIEWIGFYRMDEDGEPTFHLRPGYESTEYVPSDHGMTIGSEVVLTGAGALAGLIPACVAIGPGMAACALGGMLVSHVVMDALDVEASDYQIQVGPVYFNFQSHPSMTETWTLEHMMLQP